MYEYYTTCKYYTSLKQHSIKTGYNLHYTIQLNISPLYITLYGSIKPDGIYQIIDFL